MRTSSFIVKPSLIKRLTPAALLAVGAAHSGALFAQTAATGPQIEEILVTASKRAEVSTQESNDAIQAFGEETLSRMGVQDFTDFARSVPGLNAVDLGPGQKQYIMRGISGPGESTVGVYLDNIPLVGVGADALLAGGNQPDLGAYDVSRVEVLRGPQGTLYGASSVSGVVRYISNKPQADEFASSVQVDGASVEEGSPNYALRGMVNIPIIADKLAIRGVVYYAESGGFIDNAVLGKPASCYARLLPNPNQPGRFTPELGIQSSPGCLDGTIAPGFEDINSHTTIGGRLQARWDLTDRDSLLVQYHHQNVEMDNRTATNSFDSTYIVGPPSVNGGNNFFTPRVEDYQTNVRGLEPHEDEIDILALEYERAVGHGNLTVAASHLDRSVIDYRDSSSPSRLHRRFNLTPLGPWAGATLSRDDRVDSFQDQGAKQDSLEARFASSLDGRFNYLFGAYYQDLTTELISRVFQTDAVTGQIIPGQLTLLERDASVDQESKAAFGEIYFSPVAQLELMAGARWFDQQRDQFSNLIVPFVRSVPIGGAPGIQPSDPRSFSDTTYKGQVTWKPTDAMQIYVQYAEGFRAGGVNARITPAIPPSFDPDTATSTELGIKTAWMDARLYANVYFYDVIWDNLQLGAPFTGQFNGMVNCTERDDPAKSKGWEAEFTFAATDAITLGANYTDMDAHWTVDPTTCLTPALVATLADPLGGFAGQSLVGVPEHAGSAFIQVEFNWNSALRGFFRADLQFQGVVPVNQMRVDRNVSNPKYEIGNLRLGMETDRYEFALYVRNVSDEVANLSLFNTFQQENRVTPLQPRTVGVTFTTQF